MIPAALHAASTRPIRAGGGRLPRRETIHARCNLAFGSSSNFFGGPHRLSSKTGKARPAFPLFLFFDAKKADWTGNPHAPELRVGGGGRWRSFFFLRGRALVLWGGGGFFVWVF